MQNKPRPVPIRNLNKALIETDGAPTPLIDYSVKSDGIEVIFRNLEQKLIECIDASEVVLGCVAWLTSSPILEALSRKNCSIVVQKEDFLRPDLDSKKNFSRDLRARYSKLKCEIARYGLPGIANQLSVQGDYTVQPVRCVGNHNFNNEFAFPRSHHKFVVFCKTYVPEESNWETCEPYAVWTGSFNFTKNGTESLENAVYITDPIIVDAYAKEYAQIFALSEELDWTTAWSAPEYRIGS